MKNLLLPLVSLFFISACSNLSLENNNLQLLERLPANSSNDCSTLTLNLIRSNNSRTTSILENSSITKEMASAPIRYPKGFENIEGAQIQYGFETEYGIDELEEILKNYMPDYTFFSNTKENWLGASHQQRLGFIKDPSRKMRLFPLREKAKLIKISNDDELKDILPESLVYDDGHFEIILEPVDSIEELGRKINVINKHFGIGSMQAMISNPINKKMLLKDKKYREEMKNEMFGYYNFMNDLDTLNKLDEGYERFLTDPTIQTAKSFTHPWLGPMTQERHQQLKMVIDGIVENKQYSDEDLKKMASDVSSHKFFGGLAFRPDVAYKKDRIASEIRDCHKNTKCLQDKVIRETYFLMKGRKSFTAFQSLIPFDSTTNKFKELLTDDTRNWLESFFPKVEITMMKWNEVHKNFAYPFRDWSKHIEILNTPGLKEKIERAQSAYAEELNKITDDFMNRNIDSDTAKARYAGALGQFSRASGLNDSMKEKYKELVDPTELSFFEKLPKFD